MENLLTILKSRFEKYPNRHKKIVWEHVETKLKSSPKKIEVLQKMEATGGEPNVVDYDSKTDEYLFFDCSEESPTGRRSLCYDLDAWESRKKFKPENNVLTIAQEIGIELLDEAQYRFLQELGNFDSKTSSWLKTPSQIRALGGAIFGDFRFGTVFIYHNGADSYYAARGFRGVLRV
ncbi:MAG: DUF4256 domain-containing protein [Flavobacteriaceae bacterium]|nr:DUF4256 domain-containing protein [Flavobacteriaceae bacterium]